MVDKPGIGHETGHPGFTVIKDIYLLIYKIIILRNEHVRTQ
jgi:hypothetical protein